MKLDIIIRATDIVPELKAFNQTFREVSASLASIAAWVVKPEPPPVTGIVPVPDSPTSH